MTASKPAGGQGLKKALGLERNVVVMSLAVLLLGAGEELWTRFLPKYLEALGAGAAVIGLFGTAKDLLDAIYQYPGGFLSDRIGTRRALILFCELATIGYLIYAVASSWPHVFLGLLFATAWTSMGSPAIFATIGERLPEDRRAMGFTVQSILKRIPVLISPTIGGLLIGSLGLISGMRLSLVITAALALAAIIAQKKFYVAPTMAAAPAKLKLAAQFAAMHPVLKRLLLSDIFVRICEGMVGVFVVLYTTNVIGVTSAQFGLLMAVQMGTSIASYLPSARLADRFGRKPFVIATFICFSLFPLAVVLAQNFAWLVLAFVIGGLREMGEPARKAMIVDLADPARRGRTVGLYYLLRSFSIAPASLIGGFLWKVTPGVPFFVAAGFGFVGVALFAITVERRYAA